MSEPFSLKDHLFHAGKVQALARRIQVVYPAFDQPTFVDAVVRRLPELELKARIDWISVCLRQFLPDDYRRALQILLASLPEPCDPSLSDGDFGEFIYAPYSKFVADFGCHEDQLDVSLAALKQMTTRFSAEYAIRFFINAFPRQTLQTLAQWQYDSHYHVRRLVSEGTRPKLPWAQKIKLDPQAALIFLDHLHADPSRFVTRSVANHLNDLAKIEPNWVLERLQSWKTQNRQNPKELDFITRHALRSLIKQGHSETLLFLGYAPQTLIQISDLKLVSNQVLIGQDLQFDFEIQSQSDQAQDLIIDYRIYFCTKKEGTLSPKVFKLKQLTLPAKQILRLRKKHPFKIMTTRALYPGQHLLEIQVNGQSMARQAFELRL